MSGPGEKSPAERAAALERVLEERGVVPDGFLDAMVERAEEQLHWRNGARVVARAWTEPDFRRWLLTDGTAACASMGFTGPEGEYIVVLENTPEVHHAIVCTQCSCTAWPLLGLPPDWYKSPAYRSRVVREPRAVLREMGTEVPESVRIRIVDTTAETRFLVLPERPPGTESWSADRLAAIVTREAMIGVHHVRAPSAAEGP